MGGFKDDHVAVKKFTERAEYNTKKVVKGTAIKSSN